LTSPAQSGKRGENQMKKKKNQQKGEGGKRVSFVFIGQGAQKGRRQTSPGCNGRKELQETSKGKMNPQRQCLKGATFKPETRKKGETTEFNTGPTKLIFNRKKKNTGKKWWEKHRNADCLLKICLGAP